jgi:hypothetical protein
MKKISLPMVHEVRRWCGLSVRRREIDLRYENTGGIEIIGGLSSGLMEALIGTIFHNLNLGFDVEVFSDIQGEENKHFKTICGKMACTEEMKNVEYMNENGFFLFRKENDYVELNETVKIAWLEYSRSGMYANEAMKCHYVFRRVYQGDDVARKEGDRRRWWIQSQVNHMSRSLSCGEVAIEGVKQEKERWSFQYFGVFLLEIRKIKDEEVHEKLEQIKIDRDRQRLSGYLNKETNLFASKRATCSVL